ncbi:phytoene/squalene synthase family protein [Aerococcaceae bacterium 50-4]
MLNNISPTTIEHSFKICQNIMKNHSQSFFQAFNLLPKDMFNGVSALYAYNRFVDDLVDDNSLDSSKSLASLARLEETLIQFDAGNEIKEKEFTDLNWWPAFTHTVNKYQVPLQALIDQIEGQRLDLQQQVIDSIDDLVHYAEKVAGSVGLMLLPILVEDNQNITTSLKTACQNLGIAMQFTNILRDVGEDYRDHDRIYLPSQIMVKHQVTDDMIGQLAESPSDKPLHIPDNVIALWEEIASYSTTYYEQIHEHIQSFHPKARLPLIASAKVYQNIEEVVRENDYNCFTERQYTSKLKRTQLIRQAQKIVNE